MSRDPQAPDGGYALTPDNGAEQSSMDASHASTAHHEELLRTEALAAKRGNRAVARFAVVGLLAAIAVGVATWRSSVPDSDSARRSNVVDVSAPSALNTSTPESPAPSPSRTTTNSPAPLPYAGPVSGLAQLSEDPYLPPNSWNGGATLGPAPRTNDKQDSGTNSDQTVIQTVTPERTTESAPETPESTDRNSLLPTIPLPTIPTWPNGSSEQSSEPSQPATSNTDKPSDERGGPRVPGITTEPGEPSEPSEAGSPQSANPGAQQSQIEARNTSTPANTESPENAGNAADSQSPTRTTPNR